MTAPNTTSAARVSVHGGHSKEFGDANDSTLAEVVRAYVDKGFEWVGITEHIPPSSADFLFPWEIEAGQTLESRMEQFTEYFSVARRLQREYRDSIQILVGFETESYTGYVAHVNSLRNQFQPDYIVGSVHHVRDICIDGPPEWYAQAVEKAGGIDALFCEYFDQQYELVEELEPEVVGHFDLIRMHDKDYRQRLETPKSRRKSRGTSRRSKTLGQSSTLISGPSKRADLNLTCPNLSWKWHWILASLASRAMIHMGSRGLDCTSRKESKY